MILPLRVLPCLLLIAALASGRGFRVQGSGCGFLSDRARGGGRGGGEERESEKVREREKQRERERERERITAVSS